MVMIEAPPEVASLDTPVTAPFPVLAPLPESPIAASEPDPNADLVLGDPSDSLAPSQSQAQLQSPTKTPAKAAVAAAAIAPIAPTISPETPPPVETLPVETPLSEASLESLPPHDPAFTSAAVPPSPPAAAPPTTTPVAPTGLSVWTAKWMALATESWRHWLMMGGAAVVGVVLAAAVWGFIAADPKDDTNPPLVPAQPTAEIAASNETKPGTTPETKTDTIPDTQLLDLKDASPSKLAADSAFDKGTPVGPNAVAKVNPIPRIQPNTHPTTKPVNRKTDTASNPKTKIETTPQNKKQEKDKGKDNPKVKAETKPKIEEALPEGKSSPSTESPVMSEFPPEGDDGKKHSTSEKDADSTGSRPAPPVIDVDACLKYKIPGIEFQSTTLGDFLQFMSELSTIPITIQPEALQQARVTVDTEIAVRKTNATVGKILKEVLATQRLAYEVVDGQLVIVKASSSKEGLRKSPYTVSDLTGGSAAAMAQFAELVRTVVAPKSWNTAGGKSELLLGRNVLRVKQTEAAHFEFVVLCEKLRIARGRSPLSPYDPALFDLTTRTKQAQGNLAKPVTLQINQPTPLPVILTKLREFTGVTILIDWRALASAHWSPNTAKTIFTATKQPLGEALDTMLKPMGLTYRCINATTLQITTPHDLATRDECEFYPVPDMATTYQEADRLIDRIQSELGKGLFRGDGPGRAIVYDEPGKCLIVRLPQTAHRQLSAWLVEQRRR